MIQECETRREWLEARRGGIGASDVAAILGRDRFRSPWAVWQEKVDLLPDEEEGEPRFPSKPAEMGHRHEETVAGLFRDYCDDEDLPAGWSIYDPGEFTLYWAEGELPLFCTPDRTLLGEDRYEFAVLELKCAWQEQARRFQREFPEEHQIQAQTQVHCTGLDLAYYGVLLWGLDFKWFKQERNQRFIDAVIPKLRRFWGYVETKTPPPTDFSPATTQALSVYYNEPQDNELQLGDEYDGLGGELVGLEANAKQVARKIAAIQNRVKAELGNATAGVAPDGTLFTWRPDKRGRRTFRHKGGKADD